MSDYRRKANNGMNTTEQTAAQWAVDGRVFDVNCVLVPTDGPDQGKHKLADGIHIYNDLSFVEDGGGGGGSVTANQQAALNASNSPSGSNRYVTASDLSSYEAAFVPFIYLTSGSVTSAYRKQGTLNGKDWYVKVGSTATEESLVDSVVWDDPGTGDQWNVTDDNADVLYSSTEDVATPDLVETWVIDEGTGALPSVAYYGETSQEALEALAAATSGAMIEMVVTQSGTDAPVATVIKRTYTSTDVSFTRQSAGSYYLEAVSFFLGPCLAHITCHDTLGSAWITIEGEDTAFFGNVAENDDTSFSITLKQLN